MYRELQPFREALSQELKASLYPAVAGVDPDKLLETYLDRLTTYISVDVADQTFSALVIDAGTEILGSLDCITLPSTRCSKRTFFRKSSSRLAPKRSPRP